jgi:UDP-3-O-[3-hydroxymyristoyl] glucosamine N-acyltransferase
VETALSHIAEMVSANLIGNGSTTICGVAPFESAHAKDITVAGSKKYLKLLDMCKASAVIVPRHTTSDALNLLQVDHPLVAFAKVIAFFHPTRKLPAQIHPTAHIGEGVEWGNDVCVGACAVIGNGVRLGDRTQIHAGAVIADDVIIGDDVTVFPNVTVLDRCRIGNRVNIQAGSVIGSDGFGFAPDGEKYHKIPHVGTVCIEDDVEIGANNTIDRATFGETRICRGVKTDNLVHIAHNVTVGKNSVIVAQVGISGSVQIGEKAVVAGQAGIAGHLRIGDRAVIGPQAGIVKDVAEGQMVVGAPGTEPRRYYRILRTMQNLPELKKRLDVIEKTLRTHLKMTKSE